MSELDEQKTKIDWFKDLFKIYIAIILAVSAGLISMLSEKDTSLLFYIGICILIIVGVLATTKASEIQGEIRKLREM